jgi:hypothetical protein
MNNNYYEFFTHGEIGSVMEFWDQGRFLNEEKKEIRFPLHKRPIQVTGLYHHACSFQSKQVISKWDLLDLSKTCPTISVRLYFFEGPNAMHGNGIGLFGIWEARNGLILYSLESCLAFITDINEVELSSNLKKDPIRFLNNYLVRRTKTYEFFDKE